MGIRVTGICVGLLAAFLVAPASAVYIDRDGKSRFWSHNKARLLGASVVDNNGIIKGTTPLARGGQSFVPANWSSSASRMGSLAKTVAKRGLGPLGLVTTIAQTAGWFINDEGEIVEEKERIPEGALYYQIGEQIYRHPGVQGTSSCEGQVMQGPVSVAEPDLIACAPGYMGGASTSIDSGPTGVGSYSTGWAVTYDGATGIAYDITQIDEGCPAGYILDGDECVNVEEVLDADVGEEAKNQGRLAQLAQAIGDAIRRDVGPNPDPDTDPLLSNWPELRGALQDLEDQITAAENAADTNNDGQLSQAEIEAAPDFRPDQPNTPPEESPDINVEVDTPTGCDLLPAVCEIRDWLFAEHTPPDPPEPEWQVDMIKPEDLPEHNNPLPAGECPEDTFSVFGTEYDVPWQPMCDFATGVRPLVLGAAWLTAIFIVVRVGHL